jgi:hypothetical protein
MSGNILTAKTSEGYDIKILAELLKSNMKVGCLEISADGIGFEMCDANEIILIKFNLDAKNFNIYEFRHKESKLNVGINLQHFYNMLTSVKKKDHIQFVITSKTPNDLTLEIFSKGENFVSETSSVKIQHIQNMIIDELPTEYETSIITSSSEYQKMTKGLKRLGNVINVFGRKRQIIFSSDSNGVIRRESKFGEIDESEIEYSESFTNQQIANTAKIAGIADRIRIKYRKEYPLCLEGNIGPLGNITVFIKSREMIEKK